MINLTVVLISIFCYLGATYAQACRFIRRSVNSYALVLLPSVAVLTHTLLLYLWIEQGPGQNLTTMNLLSLVLWLLALWVIVSIRSKSISNLSLIVFPSCALSILIGWLWPGEHWLQTGADSKELLHILLSVLSVGTFLLASFQAMFLGLVEKQLRKKPPSRLLQYLPPLERMETVLFRLIRFGFLLLTLLIATAVLFFEHLLHPPLLGKTSLTLVAWLTFGGLLLGRYRLGWRGKLAVRWTLFGMGFLLLAYLAGAVLL